MEHDYIDGLNHAYDEFFAKPVENTPVLPIDTNALNIVQNPAHLKLIENRIREQMQLSPFQPSLPLNK
jgi:deoxyadenosine/deoxycytidine kinase